MKTKKKIVQNKKTESMLKLIQKTHKKKKKPSVWAKKVVDFLLEPVVIGSEEKTQPKSMVSKVRPSRWQKFKNWLNPFARPVVKTMSKEDLQAYHEAKQTKWEKFLNWLSPFKVTPVKSDAAIKPYVDKKPGVWQKILNWLSPFKSTPAPTVKTEPKKVAEVKQPVKAPEIKKPIVKPVIAKTPEQETQKMPVERIESDVEISKDNMHLAQTVYYPRKNLIAIYDTDYIKGVNSRRGLEILTVVDLNKKRKVTRRKLGGTDSYDNGVQETLSPGELSYYGASISEASRKVAKGKPVRALSVKDISIISPTEISDWQAPVVEVPNVKMQQVSVKKDEAMAQKREAIEANKENFVAENWTTEQVPDLGKLGKSRTVLAVLNPMVDSLRHKDSLTDIEMGEMSMMCRIINAYGAESRTYSYLNRLISDRFQLEVARSLANRLQKQGLNVPLHTRAVKNNYNSREEAARLRLNLIRGNRYNRAMLEELHRMGSDKAGSVNSASWLAYKYKADRNVRNGD